MLTSSMRLRSTEDFKAVRREGKRWRGRLLTINIKANNLTHCRVGFVVSKRAGKATVRNRIKRRLRTIITQQSSLFSLPYDIVIIVQQDAAHVSYSELKTEAQHLFQLARLIR